MNSVVPDLLTAFAARLSLFDLYQQRNSRETSVQGSAAHQSGRSLTLTGARIQSEDILKQTIGGAGKPFWFSSLELTMLLRSTISEHYTSRNNSGNEDELGHDGKQTDKTGHALLIGLSGYFRSVFLADIPTELFVVLKGNYLARAILQFGNFIYIFFSLPESPKYVQATGILGRPWWKFWALWSVAKPTRDRWKMGVWLLGEDDLAPEWKSSTVNWHQSTN